MATVPILLYHSVSTQPPAWIRPYAVTPETFAAHLAAVEESGAVPLTVSGLVDALDRDALPARPVVLTFDDGLADVAQHALPLLARAGAPATVYVTTGFLDGPSALPGRPPGPWLAPRDLQLLAAAGVEVGSHTHAHPQLDTMGGAAARAEIERSRAVLEDVLGARVRTFAYPHGYSSPRLRALVRQVGLDSACGVGDLLSSAADDRYALARLTVRADTPLEAVRLWLAGRGAPVAPRPEGLRARGWRGYRRARAVVLRRPGTDFPAALAR